MKAPYDSKHDIETKSVVLLETQQDRSPVIGSINFKTKLELETKIKLALSEHYCVDDWDSVQIGSYDFKMIINKMKPVTLTYTFPDDDGCLIQGELEICTNYIY